MTRRQIASMIYVFLKINDVQVTATSMNDLLNVELVNDSLKRFDQSWEETLMALEKEPEGDLVQGLYRRQLEKSTLKQNALARYHSDQVHRTDF